MCGCFLAHKWSMIALEEGCLQQPVFVQSHWLMSVISLVISAKVNVVNFGGDYDIN